MKKQRAIKVDGTSINKLNLGCGAKILTGYVNVDNNPVLADKRIVRHDLERFPYPFNDSQFDEILLDHVLEHLENPLAVLTEVYRIGKNGCRVIVNCPHFSYNWVHPLHKSPISSWLFSYLNTDNLEHYGNTKYIVESIRLSWLKSTHEKRSFPIRLIDDTINFFANIHIGITQRIFCYYVGGFEEIQFRATILK